jgi:carbamoyl-phosphate synthase large subunit
MMRILVTGLGGPAGINVVSLLPRGSVVAACDSNPRKREDLLRTGNSGVRFYTVPHARSHEAFKRAANEIIKRERIDVLIPTVDEELLVFSYRPAHFNARVVVSPYMTVKTCDDKALLYESVRDEPFCPGFVVTDRRQGLASFGPGPVFMKPRRGRGSRGARLFKNYTEIPRELINTSNVFCEYLPGQEYTADVLCDLEGNLVLAVPRKRLEVIRGISKRGETQRHPEIEENVKKLCGILKFIGPSNMQFKADTSGEMKLVEINPRFSGGLPITAEAGADVPGFLYSMLSGKGIPQTEWREGVFENRIAGMK